jgi:hypothetical protein
MHFLLTYGVAPGDNSGPVVAIHQQIETALRRYPNYRALGNTYIVKVNSETEWYEIQQAVAAIAQSSPGVTVNFLMSPLTQAPNYGGWMPKLAWDNINRLTGQ